MHAVVDFRSDTLTLPTPAMREAMARAEVGDDVWEEDPTVKRLEAMAAERLGKDAGLYVSSGTQGNLVSLCAQTQPGPVRGMAERVLMLERRQQAWQVGRIDPLALVLDLDLHPLAQPVGADRHCSPGPTMQDRVLDQVDQQLPELFLVQLGNRQAVRDLVDHLHVRVRWHQRHRLVDQRRQRAGPQHRRPLAGEVEQIADDSR